MELVKTLDQQFDEHRMNIQVRTKDLQEKIELLQDEINSLNAVDAVIDDIEENLINLRKSINFYEEQKRAGDIEGI